MQLQFELWQECNSRCKYCYLGTGNRHTNTELKLKSLQNAYNKISDLSLYPKYDTISYLGGEFFQGQLDTQEVKASFMKLMDKTAWLLEHDYIKEVWIYATMTIGDQTDLYETLDKFNIGKGRFWILTSYDTIGRFHNQKMFETWDYHMKNIYEKYPNFQINITSIITGDLIDKYLSGELSFKKMTETYHNAWFFKQCGIPDPFNKKTMNEYLPNFLPTRKKMIQFLIKFKNEESPVMWDKLFNIKYRADTLYRNFNDEDHQMVLNVRNKKSKVETNIEQEAITNKCGHLMNYATYLDCDGCVICDREMVNEMDADI